MLLRAIDLFSLFFFLFSQYSSCDNTLENCFFQISSYSPAYQRKIYEKTLRAKFPWDLYWENQSVGKQNIQDVYYM